MHALAVTDIGMFDCPEEQDGLEDLPYEGVRKVGYIGESVTRDSACYLEND